MKFTDVPNGASVFFDANVFVYHFAAEPMFGPDCRILLDRVSRGEIAGYTSTHVLSDVAHRLMTIEAINAFGWPAAGIAYRLQRHPKELQSLTRFRTSVEAVPKFGIKVLPVSLSEVLGAAAICGQFGLLCGDALVVAIAQAHGLNEIASNDADFDRVPALTRYAPG